MRKDSKVPFSLRAESPISAFQFQDPVSSPESACSRVRAKVTGIPAKA